MGKKSGSKLREDDVQFQVDNDLDQELSTKNRYDRPLKQPKFSAHAFALVPAEYVRKVIGKKNKRLDKIRKETGCKIIVQNMDGKKNSNESVMFKISGPTLNNVNCAKRRILDKLEALKSPEKRPNKPIKVEYDVPTVMKIEKMYNVDVILKSGLLTIEGIPEKVDMAHEAIEDILNFDQTFIKHEIYVPSELVGRIIGTNGRTIKRITEETKCYIKIVSKECEDSDDSLYDIESTTVVIVGDNMDDVQRAREEILKIKMVKKAESIVEIRLGKFKDGDRFVRWIQEEKGVKITTKKDHNGNGKVILTISGIAGAVKKTENALRSFFSL